jgi:rRNA processing protein Gar1
MSTKIMLGKGMHQSKGNHNLIITLQLDARIGQIVFDKDGNSIGKIFDIFGPVETPYASIKLNEGLELGKVDGKPVFLGGIPLKKKKRRKKGRRSR